MTVEEKYWKADEYLRHERSELRGSYCLAFVAMIFFCVLPITLFMLGIIMLLAGGPGWFFLFSGVVALVSVGLWTYIIKQPGALETPPVLRRKLKQLKRCRALRDTILSYRMDGDAAEIVFAESGTARYPCDSKTYDKLFVVPRHEAIVVMDKNRLHSIALLPEAEEAAPAGALSEEDASIGTENDILLSDEELHRAALREIENMKPARRTELEAEIEDRMDRQDQILEKGLSNLTTLEQGELHKLSWADLHHSVVDIQQSAIESAVMEKLGVTKKDIMNMKKNPFTATLGRKLLIAAVVVAIGAVGTAAVEKVTGAKLGFVYIIFSVISGSIALSCGEEVMNITRFRKLKKSYFDPQYRKKVLDAAVYKEIREQVKQRREKQ